ncbi:hypothetical protein FB451DRAFT_1197794 [Mycena latifolia]|nr:hypothetical protein FB451DRAFT_1197794 [Mycena latifolia]
MGYSILQLALLTVCALADDITSYTDNALASGWENWSWSSDLNFTATDLYEGTSSISVNSEAWSALSVKLEGTFLDYQGRFDIAGAQPNLRITISSSVDGTTSPNIQFSSLNTSITPDAATAWDRIIFQAGGNGDIYHVDNIFVVESIVVSAEPLAANTIAVTRRLLRAQRVLQRRASGLCMRGHIFNLSLVGNQDPEHDELRRRGMPSTSVTYLALAAPFAAGTLAINTGANAFNLTLNAMQSARERFTHSIAQQVTHPISPLIYSVNFPPSAPYVALGRERRDGVQPGGAVHECRKCLAKQDRTPSTRMLATASSRAGQAWLKRLASKPTLVAIDNEIEIVSRTHQDMHPALGMVLEVDTSAESVGAGCNTGKNARAVRGGGFRVPRRRRGCPLEENTDDSGADCNLYFSTLTKRKEMHRGCSRIVVRVLLKGVHADAGLCLRVRRGKGIDAGWHWSRCRIGVARNAWLRRRGSVRRAGAAGWDRCRESLSYGRAWKRADSAVNGGRVPAGLTVRAWRRPLWAAAGGREEGRERSEGRNSASASFSASMLGSALSSIFRLRLPPIGLYRVCPIASPFLGCSASREPRRAPVVLLARARPLPPIVFGFAPPPVGHAPRAADRAAKESGPTAASAGGRKLVLISRRGTSEYAAQHSAGCIAWDLGLRA